MDTKTISVDLNTLVPVVISVLAPAVVGFLQEYKKKFEETGKWYLKGAISSGIAALIALIGSYAASGDVLLASAAGATVGALGSVNIYFRKGSRANLETVIKSRVDSECAEAGTKAPTP